MKFVVISALLFLPVSVYAQATLFLISKNGNVSFDQSQYPPKLKAGIEILNSKCESCHSLARVINALETGQTASGLPFDKSGIKEFVVKKVRRPDVGLGGRDAAELRRALEYILGGS